MSQKTSLCVVEVLICLHYLLLKTSFFATFKSETCGDKIRASTEGKMSDLGLTEVY